MSFTYTLSTSSIIMSLSKWHHTSPERDRLKPVPPPKPKALVTVTGVVPAGVVAIPSQPLEYFAHLRQLHRRCKEIRSEVRLHASCLAHLLDWYQPNTSDCLSQLKSASKDELSHTHFECGDT